MQMQLTRCEFLRLGSVVAVSTTLVACNMNSTPTSTPRSTASSARQLLELLPFPTLDHPSNLDLRVAVEHQPNALVLHYELSDPQSQVVLPTPAESPQRRDQLWQATCFECFMGAVGDAAYWEMNFSPSGHWNIYHFDAYREGMRQEERIADVRLRIMRAQGKFTLDAEIDLAKLNLGNTPIQLGITAVIKTADDVSNYYALAHRSVKPDFHLRESFVLKM